MNWLTKGWAIAGGWMLLNAVSVPAIAQGSARFTPPPSDAPPLNRVRPSGRPRCGCNRRSLQVTPLASPDRLNTTLSAQPALYFFSSEEDYSLFFTLEDAESLDPVYEERISLQNSRGLIEIQLPQQSLQLNKTYRWRIYGAYNGTLRPDSPLVSGYLQRTDSTDVNFTYDPTSEQSVEAKLDLFEDYKAAGYWIDAVTLLAELRAQHPTARNVRSAWNELLDSLELDAELNEVVS